MNTLEIVSSVAEMIDKSKLYVKDGTIWQYGARVNVLVPDNLIKKSENADGTPYNDGQGWKTGYTMNAGTGAERTMDGYECTGFIPITASDTFRIQNYGFDSEVTQYNLLVFYDSDHTYIGAFTGTSTYNPLTQFVKDDGVMEGCIATAATTNFTEAKKTSIAYMRLGFHAITKETSCFVNLFEETAQLEDVAWYDTKFPYYGEVSESTKNTVEGLSGTVAKILRYMGLHN